MKALIVSICLMSIVLVGCNHLKSLHQTKASSEPTPEANASPAVQPSGRGTPAEAKAMMLKAVEHYNAVGRTKALADFTAMKSPFGDRDLYVVCIGSNHKITANGGFAQYVGVSSDVWKDADGKSLGQAIWNAAWEPGEGTVQYKWINPVSHVTEKKIGFFKKVGEDVCGVGAYQPE